MRCDQAILVAMAACCVAPPALPRSAAAEPPAERGGLEAAGEERETITLRVRFLIRRDLVIEVGGEKLTIWISAEELRGEVLPEVNRIWRQAGVRFAEESIVEVPAARSDEHERVLEAIAANGRDERGRSDPRLLTKIRGLFPADVLHPTAHNVILFPYIGKTLQGNAVIGGNVAAVGLWTDKDSRGQEPPHRVALREPEPFRIGSLGRTLAHELGHSLGLQHPGRTDPIRGRLMGGRSPGYLLTDEEIASARDEAWRHAAGIIGKGLQDRP